MPSAELGGGGAGLGENVAWCLGSDSQAGQLTFLFLAFFHEELKCCGLNQYNGPQEQAGCGHDRAPRPGAAVIISGPACHSANKAFYEDEMGCALPPNHARHSWVVI